MRDLFPDLATAQFVRTQLPQFLHIVCDLNWNWRKGMRNEVRKRQTKDAVEQTASIYDRFACKLCWRLPGYRTLPTHWWTNSQQSRLLSFTFKQRLENTAPRDYKHTPNIHNISHHLHSMIYTLNISRIIVVIVLATLNLQPFPQALKAVKPLAVIPHYRPCAWFVYYAWKYTIFRILTAVL